MGRQNKQTMLQSVPTKTPQRLVPALVTLLPSSSNQMDSWYPKVPCCQSRGPPGLEPDPLLMDLHLLLNLSSQEQEGLVQGLPALAEQWLGVVLGPLVPPLSPQWQTT